MCNTPAERDDSAVAAEARTSPGSIPLGWLTSLRLTPPAPRSPRLGYILIGIWVIGVIACLLRLASGLIGVFDGGIHGKLIVSAKDEAGAKACRGAIGLLGKMFSTTFAEERKSADAKDNEMGSRLSAELLKSAKVKCEGAMLTIEAHCSVELAELAAQTAADAAAVKDEK